MIHVIVIFFIGFLCFIVPWPSHLGPRKAFLFSAWHLTKSFLATGFQTFNILIWKAHLLCSPLCFIFPKQLPLFPRCQGMGAACHSWLLQISCHGLLTYFFTLAPHNLSLSLFWGKWWRQVTGKEAHLFPTFFFPSRTLFLCSESCFQHESFIQEHLSMDYPVLLMALTLVSCWQS